MLVLSRKAQQSIVIDDTIVVTVLSIRGNTVKLGIAAPNEVSVVRQEIAHLPARRPPVRKSGNGAGSSSQTLYAIAEA